MKNKKLVMALAAVCLTVSVSGCGGKTAQLKETVPAEGATTEAAATEAATTEAADGSEGKGGDAGSKGGTAESGNEAEKTQEAKAGGSGNSGGESAMDGQTRIITDSAGREVEIPAEITKIAPSGPLAQIVLYTVSPDRLAGLATDFSDEAKQYIDEKYWGLPKFGQFYGKNASLNMEALIAEAPDVIIDIGEAKKSVKEDMDALQEQLDIPVIFVEATLPTMAEAYEMLGEITGDKEQAEKLASYCKNMIEKAGETAAAIADKDRKSVYFASGDDGLHTNAKGSIHADVIERVGAVNAADVEAVANGAGSEVSFEQLLLWEPDIIIVDKQKLYDSIINDDMWKELAAVSEGRIYKIPSAPYSFMNSPPSVNRMIGIEWLGSLVYPEYYQADIREEVKEFYQLFYHIDVTEEELDSILTDSLAK